MIDAKELRIGNIVHIALKEYGEIDPMRFYSICSIGWFEVNVLPFRPIITYGDYKTIRLQDIYPIPLTPEILEKCGFGVTIKNADSGYREYRKRMRGFDFIFCVECNESPAFYLENIAVDIEYLHQFQNVFYSLSQTELEVKL